MNYSQRKNIRLSRHDYSAEDMYFVTICTEGRVQVLGESVGDKVILTTIGAIVHESWNKIGILYQNISLDAFIIMPNHIHGIVIYQSPTAGEPCMPLGQVIRNFKSFTTHEYYKDRTRTTGNLWHRGYYEHVIRHDELDVIREYIMNNPLNWENDKFYELEKLYLQSLHKVNSCAGNVQS